MNKILGSLCVFISFLSAGSITATVDSTEVVEGDSVLLTLAVTGENVDIIPDIPEIDGKKVFNIKRPPMLSNYVSVNGKSHMEKTHLMIMEFRPDSEMLIPSFSAMVDGKMEVTKPIKVKVLKAVKGMKRETKDFSLDIKIEKSKFYVGEPIVLNLYFKQRINSDVVKIEYAPPAFKEFFSKQLGKGKTYKKDGFSIQELTYLLIAKKSGKLTLEPARAKIAQRSRERQKGGWFIDVPKWTKVSSPSLALEVLAPSEKHDLVGKYRLTDTVDHEKVKLNKPVTLRMELAGEGTFDDYEGISFDIPSVTIYSDDAKIESKLMGNKLQSHYQKSFVFIADHDFIIPSKEVQVYDYKAGKVKTLKTKEYHIEVESGVKNRASSMVHTQTPRQSINSSSRSTEPCYAKLPSMLLLLLTFALGVFVTLFFKYLPTSLFENLRFNRTKIKHEEALKILYPKIGESTEVEAMVRQLYAVKRGDKSVEIDRDHLEKLVKKYARS